MWHQLSTNKFNQKLPCHNFFPSYHGHCKRVDLCAVAKGKVEEERERCTKRARKKKNKKTANAVGERAAEGRLEVY